MNKLVMALTCAAALSGLAAEREAMSPFDDAAYWFRGGVDLNGNGTYDSGSCEFRDVTHAANAAHANHVMKLDKTGADYDPIKACTGKVVMPYAGQVLTDAPYLHLPQRVETNGTFLSETGVEYPIVKLHANFINLPNFLSDLPSGQACTEYTVFLRFRSLSRVSERQSEHNLFQLGYAWGTGQSGLSLNVVHQGSYFTPKAYFGSNQQKIDSIDGFKFRYGQWHDLAVVVKNGGQTVEFAAVANVSESPVTNRIFAYTNLTPASGTTPAIISSRRWGRLGGEQSGISGTYTNGYAQGTSGTHDDPALSNKAKCLRGDIQTFAFWARALTTNEIRQVFSERRPAVIRMGLANGSSDEFLGTDDGTTDANGFHPEAWNPVLNPDHPSTTVKFSVEDGEQGVGQYLRIRPVPGSATAVLSVKVDGNLIAIQRVSGSDDTLLFVNGSYLTKGRHAISFERKDSGDEDFAIDAFLLAGSWRIGNTANEYGGMSHETSYPHQYASPRRFPLTDGNMNHFARGLSGGSGNDNGTHIIPFTIPSDIYEKMTDPTLTLGFAGGSSDLSILVNGTEVKTFSGFDSAGSVSCAIPVANLVAGENELKVHQTSSGGWLNCCKYILELGPMPADVKTLNADDPHADAEIWWRGTDMKTADGTANKASLYNSATGETIVPTVAGTANDVQIRTEPIFCPYRHRATTGKAIYFAQPTWTNEVAYADGSTTNFLHVRSSRLDFSGVFSNLAVPLSNYTVQVRFRVDESPSRWSGVQRWMIRTGFDWNGNCGLAFGLAADNSTDLKLTCYRGQEGFTPSAGTTTSRTNSWNDVIISVRDAKTITTIFCAENDYPRLGTHEASSANAYIRKGGVFQIGTEDTTADASVVLGKTANATCWKCFRGSIAEVAFWRRTLTEAEMRAALGNPLPGIFRLGVDNGMSTEFTGNAAAAEYDADSDTLAAAAPVLTADSPEVTVKAFVSQMNATLPQVLRLKPTMEFGGTATVRLHVNGREAGEPVVVEPDAFACFSVRPTYYRANATNEFRLVRTDAGRNALTVDMIDLVGSWDLGGPETSNIYFSHESSAPVDYYVSNGRWLSLVRGVTASNKTSPAFRIHFTVPKGFAEEYDYRYDFRLSDGTGGSAPEERPLFKVLLNGESVWSTIESPTTDSTLRPYVIDLGNNPIRFPAGTLKEGDNTLEVYALPNSPAGKYQSFCRHRLRLVQPRIGSLMILK